MARIRTVKPEFWDDQKLCTISRDARLTYIGLWTHSDDFGVVKAHLAWLKNKIYPYDDVKQSEFTKWINELETIGRIIKFSHNGEDYYYIHKFAKHQFVNRPNQNNRNPPPPDDVLNAHGTINEASMKDHGDIHSVKEGIVRDIDSVNGIPFNEIQKAFNTICHELPEFRDLTPQRKDAIKKRWHTDEKTCNLEWWVKQFFPLIAESDFLTGRSGKWTSCNIDWILKPTNFQKIREATYNRN